jgi:hypothetical protein
MKAKTEQPQMPSLKDDFLDMFPGLKSPVQRPEMICPHCQAKGQITTKTVKRKAGLDGGKVVGFLIGLAASFIFLGVTVAILWICLGVFASFTLKKKATEANCQNCKAVWSF